MTGHGTWLTVGLAWLYFASRCAHSYIHLGTKNVVHRFSTYAAGGLVLAALWLTLLVSMLSSAA